jgi:1-acyl-sn-glycerol-3-phosphate acyltransferase
MLRTIFFYIIFYPFTLIGSIVALFASFIGAEQAHAVAIFWGATCLRLAGGKIKVEGRENIPTDRAAIFMANHSSSFDIPALYAALPVQFRWLAKKELFAVPLFGMALKRIGYIPVERSDSRKALLALKAAAQRVKNGTPIIVFPEGTRSPDGNLLPFKGGGFIIAVQSGMPIVPVVISGTRNITPQGSLSVSAADVVIRILPPIETGGLKSSDRNALSDQVRQSIESALQPESPEHAR